MSLHHDEIPVDESLVRRLLDDEWPELAELPITPVGGGTDNMMYRIGTDHLARLPRTPDKAQGLAKEARWLPRLQPHLSRTIPTPHHVGRPEPFYPIEWAVFGWIDGDEASADAVTDWPAYGRDLAEFVVELRATDLMGATRSPGLDGYRGGLLAPNDGWVSDAFDQVRVRVAAGAELELDLGVLDRWWRHGLALPAPANAIGWLHSDLKPTNVLVRDGRLHAVIDFGGLAVGYGDAEHAVTWDLPADARAAYRDVLGLDGATWARARAWAVAVGISGVAYYWDTFPAFWAECVRRLQEITTDPG